MFRSWDGAWMAPRHDVTAGGGQARAKRCGRERHTESWSGKGGTQPAKAFGDLGGPPPGAVTVIAEVQGNERTGPGVGGPLRSTGSDGRRAAQS
jgi:hypothetical protein